MRFSFFQFLFIVFLGILFFADFNHLAKLAKQKIKDYKKVE